MEPTKIAAVVGVGPGLGAAVARRFAREGYRVALLARRAESLIDTTKAIAEAGGRSIEVLADAGNPASVSAAFAEIRAKLGDPGVLVYNASGFQPGSVLDLTPEQLESCWKVGCLGAFVAAKEVIPAMLTRGQGTILLTGATAALRGSANFAALAVPKFGLRALGQSLARELHPKGIHVCHAIIDGPIDSARARGMGRPLESLLNPDAIADVYWDLHRQDRTVWTQELDLRPATEKF
jgi:NAD(P)-dependent dehydrogenase (short-subunit alcohol dehydrogenase family)